MKLKSIVKLLALIMALSLTIVTFASCDLLLADSGIMKGEKGEPGVSVSNVYIDEYGHLIVILSDGRTIDAGAVDGSSTQPVNPDNSDNTPSGEAYTVSGAVYTADERNPIENAKIDVYYDENYVHLYTSTTSLYDGSYSVSLPAGDYYIKITANGFISFESIHVIRDEDTFLESFLMVEGNDNGINQNGSVGGRIVNSVTGGIVDEATLSIRKGWNQLSGEIIATTTTDSNGYYSLNLPLGNYTVVIEKFSFVLNHINIVVTTTPNQDGFNASIVPDGDSDVPTGDLRVVLSWGEYPLDLDSHMIGPTATTNDYNIDRFHIYFSDKQYYYSGELKAFLDVDDIESYGPETITVYSMNSSGTYSYYIHDYSNKEYSQTNQLSMSGAKVQVYVGDSLVATYNVPTSRNGTVWHVFDFDAATRRITAVNSFSYASDPYFVGQ